MSGRGRLQGGDGVAYFDFTHVLANGAGFALLLCNCRGFDVRRLHVALPGFSQSEHHPTLQLLSRRELARISSQSGRRGALLLHSDGGGGWTIGGVAVAVLGRVQPAEQREKIRNEATAGDSRQQINGWQRVEGVHADLQAAVTSVCEGRGVCEGRSVCEGRV